eukprot:13761919-Heterocapsa_arctica.AAC.1
MSATVRFGTSIVAGCTFATTLLSVVLLECFDLASKRYIEVSFYVYVDDIDLGGLQERTNKSLRAWQEQPDS